MRARSCCPKVYFPRLLLPVAAAAALVLDFVISFVLLLILMICVRDRHLTAPCSGSLPLTVLCWTAALAVGHLALGAQRPVPRRPVRGAVPRSSSGSSLSPIAYPSSPGAREVALALRPEPDGRRRRGLPLGAARGRGTARLAPCSSSAVIAVVVLVTGVAVLPAHASDLRGRDLRCPMLVVEAKASASAIGSATAQYATATCARRSRQAPGASRRRGGGGRGIADARPLGAPRRLLRGARGRGRRRSSAATARASARC